MFRSDRTDLNNTLFDCLFLNYGMRFKRGSQNIYYYFVINIKQSVELAVERRSRHNSST